MAKSNLPRVGQFETRNGTFEFSRLHAWGGTSGVVYLDAIGLRNVKIRGGFLIYDPAVLDEFCVEFLRQRGYNVQGTAKPEASLVKQIDVYTTYVKETA